MAGYLPTANFAESGKQAARCLLLRWDAQPLQTVYCCAHSSIRRGRSRLHLERKEVAQLLPSVDDEVLEKHLGVWGWQPDTVRRALH